MAFKFWGMGINECPQCNGVGTVRKILWGMPDGPVDESKYAIGGCLVSPDGNDPTHTCIECGWERFNSREPYEEYPPKFLESLENALDEKADIEFKFEQ